MPHPAGIKLFAGLRGVAAADLPSEVMAGVTLAALAIPLNIGYAQVAGVPPVMGLYAAIVPMAIFAVFCSSRQLVAGPDAPIAALIGSILVALASPSDPAYMQLAIALALVCSAVFLLLWVFRLGFLANFLSGAVLVGFVSGLGIEVFTSQIPKILGIHVDAEEWLGKVAGIVQGLPTTNVYALAVGLGTIVIIRLFKRFLPAVPGALVALVIMTVIVGAFGLDQRGVSVLGSVPSGLPHLEFPRVAPIDYLRLFPGALAVCGITLADGLLVGRRYAQLRGYPIDANQELLAFGVANVAGGLTGSLVTGSSGARTAAMDGAGSRSQVPSVVGAGVVALVLLFFANLLALLPNAVLGGIVANAVLALVEVKELRELYRIRRSEFAVAVVCGLSVLLIGTISAVVIAFLLSVIDVVRRAAAPSSGVLREPPGQQGFVLDGTDQARTVPGLVVYRFGAELFFANADTFRQEIQALVTTRTGPRVEWLVLDAEAISDIDSTGADTLGRVLDFLAQQHVTFGVTRLAPVVKHQLERYELLERINATQMFDTNHNAVDAFISRDTQTQSVAT